MNVKGWCHGFARSLWGVSRADRAETAAGIATVAPWQAPRRKSSAHTVSVRKQVAVFRVAEFCLQSGFPLSAEFGTASVRKRSFYVSLGDAGVCEKH